MDFVRIESVCYEDMNAVLKCPYCGKEELVYGKNNDQWFTEELPLYHCKHCTEGRVKNKKQE